MTLAPYTDTLNYYRQVGNLICHLMLSNLRPPGTKERRIPRGFLFEYTVCPNYTCEVFAWVGFSLMTNIYLSWLFTAFGFYQMVSVCAFVLLLLLLQLTPPLLRSPTSPPLLTAGVGI